jgi:hypothetical protein
MPTDLFEALRARRNRIAADAQARYNNLVQQLAGGTDVDPDEAEQIMAAVGLTDDEAEEAVKEAIEKINRAKPPVLPPLPSPAELHTKHVSHDQIGRIWGLYDDRGYGRFDLVQRELDEPGSVLTPEYVTHWNACRMAAAGFGERPAPWPFPPMPGTFGTAATIEDLLRQRVPGEQIIKVLGDDEGRLTIEKLRAMAESLGVPFFPNSRALANQHAQDILREQAQYANLDGEAMLNRPKETVHALVPREIGPDAMEEDAGDSEQPIEEMIADLHGAGHDAATIAKYTGLPKRKVEQMIARSYAELQDR